MLVACMEPCCLYGTELIQFIVFLLSINNFSSELFTHSLVYCDWEKNLIAAKQSQESIPNSIDILVGLRPYGHRTIDITIPKLFGTILFSWTASSFNIFTTKTNRRLTTKKISCFVYLTLKQTNILRESWMFHLSLFEEKYSNFTRYQSHERCYFTRVYLTRNSCETETGVVEWSRYFLQQPISTTTCNTLISKAEKCSPKFSFKIKSNLANDDA